jgi:hypothetical protein
MSALKSSLEKEHVTSVTEDGIIYLVKTDANGTKKWYCDEKLSRIKGPAIEHPDGCFVWYNDGLISRTDGPAVVSKDGIFFFYKGKIHNLNGPAAIYNNGLKFWAINGLLQKKEGPALETDSHKFWVMDNKITQIKYLNKAKMNPKTQKAKSILFGCAELQEQSSYIYSLRGYGTKSLILKDPILISSKKDITDLDPKFWKDKKIFARPCPKVPRHGFVDSRVISNKEELKSLYKEVLKEDPQGEIVLTNFLDNAVCNAVLTTGGTISIGPGHNGATAGKNSFSFPVKPEELPLKATIEDWVKNKKRIRDRLNRINKRLKKYNKQKIHFEFRLKVIKDYEK